MAKICILVPAHWSAFKGGAEYQADCLADYMTKVTPHQVVYLGRDIAENPSYRYQIEKVSPVFKNFSRGLFWDSIRLYNKLKQIDPDVILQHVGCAYTGVAAFYSKRHKKNMIWYLASDIDVEKRSYTFALKQWTKIIDNYFEKYGLRNSTQIIAQTKTQAKLLKENYGRIADDIIPNFHPIPVSDNQKAERLKVLWVANLKGLKQPEIFIQLAREFSFQENIEFNVIGRRNNSNWCLNILEEIKRTPNMQYLGEMENEEVNRQLESAHILVNTSTYEGFPNTFIQAWMREVPTLSLNVDPDGVITENNIGLHAKNFENLKNYIFHMSRHRDELKVVGERAKQIAIRDYSMGNADRIIKRLDSVLSVNSW